MNDDARRRLKEALVIKGRQAAEVCRALNYENDKYLSRVISGNIKNPSAQRLEEVTREIGVSLNWVLTGKELAVEKEEFIRRLANENEDVINEVARYVRDRGLMKS